MGSSKRSRKAKQSVSYKDDEVGCGDNNANDDGPSLHLHICTFAHLHIWRRRRRRGRRRRGWGDADMFTTLPLGIDYMSEKKNKSSS
jgi:hypothetical protein